MSRNTIQQHHENNVAPCRLIASRKLQVTRKEVTNSTLTNENMLGCHNNMIKHGWWKQRGKHFASHCYYSTGSYQHFLSSNSDITIIKSSMKHYMSKSIMHHSWFISNHTTGFFALQCSFPSWSLKVFERKSTIPHSLVLLL